MDFSAPIGAPIYATGDGVIKKITDRKTGFGKRIEIDHGFGYESLYAHLNKFNVKLRQKVKRGDIIGYVGNTGNASHANPHLHFAIYTPSVINPYPRLSYVLSKSIYDDESTTVLQNTIPLVDLEDGDENAEVRLLQLFLINNS